MTPKYFKIDNDVIEFERLQEIFQPNTNSYSVSISFQGDIMDRLRTALQTHTGTTFQILADDQSTVAIQYENAEIGRITTSFELRRIAPSTSVELVNVNGMTLTALKTVG